MAGTSRSASKQPLMDGSFRRSWRPPQTEEEWMSLGKTRADFPITEEERQAMDDAYDEYMNTHDYQEIPSPERRPSASNTPASQIMSARMKASILKTQEEIDELAELWRNSRNQQLAIEAVIEEKKGQVKALQREIREEEKKAKDIKENYPGLEDMINEKAEWIIKCKALYPEGY